MVQADDVQKLFLQAILSRGVLSEKLAKLLWKKCVEAIKTADDDIEVSYSDEDNEWAEFLKGVNASLDDLDFEFKSIQDELQGKVLFAMVNRKDDELAQLATDYNAVEIMYFKAVVEQIMLARNESFSVSSLAALREVSAGKEKINLTKTQAEVLLGSFVANGWLLRSKRGRYSLSPRSLLELLPYIKSTYPDEMIECTICHYMMTKGIACKRDNCKTRMHYHCFKSYRTRNRTTCPACSIDWPPNATDDGLLSVGELAVRDGDDGRRQTRGSPDSEDDDEEMEDEPPQTQIKSRQPQRSQAAKKGKSKKMDVESEEEAEDKNETDEEEEEAEDKPPPRRRSNRK